MNGVDLRNYSRQTNIRLIIGSILIIFIVGDGLIFFIYGPGPALVGFLCLVAGLLPILLILLIFWIIDKVVKRANRE